jgi:multimeric flavodoxin WrbA
MLDAVRAGATDPSIEGVEVVVRAALAATVVDVLTADAYLLGTPANLGYMSGALKHFFDQIYYPCLDATRGRTYGLFVHGNNDTGGAVRGVETITTGLQWRLGQRVVSVTGEPSSTDREACWELGASLAALLASSDE